MARSLASNDMIFDIRPRYACGLLCLAVLGCKPNLSVGKWQEREKFENLGSGEFGLIVYPGAANFKGGDVATWRVKGRIKDLPSVFFAFRSCEVVRAGSDYHFAATIDFKDGHLTILRSGEIIDDIVNGDSPSGRLFAYSDEATAYQVREFLSGISGVDQRQVLNNLEATQKKCLVREP